MPAQVQSAAAISRLLRKLGIQGKHPLTLDSTVVPVAIIEDVSEQVGAEAAVGVWAFIRANATVAVAGAMVLTNEVGSAVDLIVDEIRFQTAVANTYRLNQTDIAVGALTAGILHKFWMDTNHLPGIPPGVINHADGGAFGAAPSAYIAGPTVAQIPVNIPVGWTLSPGQSFVVRSITVNIAIDGYIKYRAIPRTD